MFSSHGKPNLWNVLTIIKCWIGVKIRPIKQISNSFATTANQIMIVLKINPQSNGNTIVVFHPGYKRTKFLFNIWWDSFVEADIKIRRNVFRNFQFYCLSLFPNTIFSHKYHLFVKSNFKYWRGSAQGSLV